MAGVSLSPPVMAGSLSPRHGRAQPSEGRRRIRSPMPGHPRSSPSRRVMPRQEPRRGWPGLRPAMTERGLSHLPHSAKARRNPQMSESSMIPRYTRPEMASIWEPLTRFRIWFEIEAHAADAQAELGVIPKEAAKTIWAKGKDAPFNVARIDEIEREVKHDVIAFLTHLAEFVGPDSRF